MKWLKTDGTIGKTFVAFKDIAEHCDSRLFETHLDLISSINPDDKSRVGGTGRASARSGSGGGRVIGEVVLQVFRLPPLPGIPPEQLPQSLEECMRGMRHIHWHKVTYHEGVLTQNGGDCLVRDQNVGTLSLV